MGWAGGSELAETVWEAVRHFIPEEDKNVVAKQIIDAFEDQDCDTIYECEQLIKDAGLEAEYWPEKDDE